MADFTFLNVVQWIIGFTHTLETPPNKCSYRQASTRMRRI